MAKISDLHAQATGFCALFKKSLSQTFGPSAPQSFPNLQLFLPNFPRGVHAWQ